MQRANSEMINILATSGQKYMKQTSKRKSPGGNQTRNPKKHKRSQFQEDDKIPLIAIGEGSFSSSMKGTIPGRAGRLNKLAKTAERQGLLVVTPVTRFKTSVTCSNCHKDKNEKVKVQNEPMHGVLRCTDEKCNTIWQRVTNASRNIHFIAEHIMNPRFLALLR